MTSSRVYRTALPLEVALARIERNIGTQFDPLVARQLLQLVRSGRLAVGEDDAGGPAPPRLAAASRN